MKWEACKNYIIGGAVFAIIAIVIIVLVVSKRQSYADETETRETTLQSSLQTNNNASPTSQDNNKTENETNSTIDTKTNGQDESTNPTYGAPVIDFNDLLNLPGNVNTEKESQTEKTETTNTTEETKPTESNSIHENESTTHSDPDGPGWSDWIMP